MSRLIVIYLLATFALIEVDIALGDSQAQKIIGEAFSLSGDQLVYREEHCISDDNMNHRVNYLDGENRLIAQKQLKYYSDRTQPEFVQANRLTDELMGVKLHKNRFIMAHTNKKNSRNKYRALVPDQQLPLVIDAGFNEFVRANWVKLLAGDKLSFQFPLVSQSRVIELQLVSSVCDAVNPMYQCFRMELSNWLLRLAVDPIQLKYEIASRRLKGFKGLSNINDENGDGYVVDIRYQYPGLESESCNLEAMANLTLDLPDEDAMQKIDRPHIDKLNEESQK